MRVTGIDHVQLAMPAGQEELAREFYSRTLFRPARKAHPALIVRDLESLVASLRSKGHEIVPCDGVPRSFRVHVSDPFGNRIELIEAR
jgi:hypothetical protein